MNDKLKLFSKNFLIFIGNFLVSCIGGIIGSSSYEMYKDSNQPTLEIIAPNNNEHVSLPVNIVVRYTNLPADHYICLFSKGKEDTKYYPILSNKEKTDKNGEVQFQIDHLGSEDDNGLPFFLIAGIANGKDYPKMRSTFDNKTNDFVYDIPATIIAKTWVTVFRERKYPRDWP